VDDNVALVCDPADFDDRKQEGFLRVRLRNTSQQRLYGPIQAKVVRAIGCVLPDGKELDFTPALRDLPYLPPGALTEAVRVRFRPSNLGAETAGLWPSVLLKVTARTQVDRKTKE
jgi:hypothetical protein